MLLSRTRSTPVASLGSGHWERDSWEREQGKGSWESYCYGDNVVSLQINTAGIMAMNRVDRIVLDPIRTYACTRTARTGVWVTVGLVVETNLFQPAEQKNWDSTVLYILSYLY